MFYANAARKIKSNPCRRTMVPGAVRSLSVARFSGPKTCVRRVCRTFLCQEKAVTARDPRARPCSVRARYIREDIHEIYSRGVIRVQVGANGQRSCSEIERGVRACARVRARAAHSADNRPSSFKDRAVGRARIYIGQPSSCQCWKTVLRWCDVYCARRPRKCTKITVTM